MEGSEHQFVLNWQVMWEEQDVEAGPALIEGTKDLFPGLRSCSFDKGFYSPANRTRLDGVLELNVMPKKGRLSKADLERETGAEHVALRRLHAGVESGISNLEQRGLDRVLDHGQDGFERAVALSVVAANVHRIGLVLQRRERGRLNKERLRKAA